MVDFHYLDEIAIRIKSDRQQLTNIEAELSRVNFRIHELPLKSVTESTFAKMIGEQYHDELGELEKIKNELLSEKEKLSEAIKNDTDTFVTEISSTDLIIPLELPPKFQDGNTIFKFKDGARFSNLLDMLSELLGLSAPILVKDVMFSSSEIIVKVSDEYEAKQKFISSMNEIQKTLSIKKR
jgi:hypothetical protein